MRRVRGSRDHEKGQGQQGSLAAGIVREDSVMRREQFQQRDHEKGQGQQGS
jgi:hypothetical protein